MQSFGFHQLTSRAWTPIDKLQELLARPKVASGGPDRDMNGPGPSGPTVNDVVHV